MHAHVGRRNNIHIPLPARLLLVLVAWSVVLLLMFLWTAPAWPRGLLIAGLGEDGIPVWLQNAVCLLCIGITWALLAYSRPIGFFVLYGVLIILLLLSTIVLAWTVGLSDVRFFP